MNWNAIENALRTWVRSATGLGDAAVIFADQTGQRPAAPFVTIKLGTIIPLGAFDETRTIYDADADPGEEVELRVSGQREFSVSLQAFSTVVTSPTSDTLPARALLGKCQTALQLPTVKAAFDTAGVSCFDVGSVLNLSALVGTLFEGRAALDCRFYATDTASEFVGFIDEVETTSYLGPPDEGTAEDIDI